MKKSNTAIILILNDFLIPHRVTAGVVEVQAKDCINADLKDSNGWIGVPDIITAKWVTGTLA